MKRDKRELIPQLMDTLKHLGASQTNPITAGVLSDWLNLDETESTYPRARMVIRNAIDAGHPIVSNRHGYFVARTQKQLQVYLNDLMGRQIKLSARILGVYKAYHGKAKHGK